jgi:hypothetical protein
MRNAQNQQKEDEQPVAGSSTRNQVLSEDIGADSFTQQCSARSRRPRTRTRSSRRVKYKLVWCPLLIILFQYSGNAGTRTRNAHSSVQESRGYWGNGQSKEEKKHGIKDSDDDDMDEDEDAYTAPSSTMRDAANTNLHLEGLRHVSSPKNDLP